MNKIIMLFITLFIAIPLISMEEPAIATLAGLHKLKTLTLYNNQLKELNPRIIRVLSNLKTLNLKNNPLDPQAVQTLRKEFPKIGIIF